jgi:hypothetical protein
MVCAYVLDMGVFKTMVILGTCPNLFGGKKEMSNTFDEEKLTMMYIMRFLCVHPSDCGCGLKITDCFFKV